MPYTRPRLQVLRPLPAEQDQAQRAHSDQYLREVVGTTYRPRCAAS